MRIPRLLLVLFLVLPMGLVAAVECDRHAGVDVNAAATSVIVTGVAGRTIVVCGFVITADTTATTAQFKFGTGTTCGTSTTNISAPLRLAANGNISYGNGIGVIFRADPGTDLCLAAVTGAVSGIVTYQIR